MKRAATLLALLLGSTVVSAQALYDSSKVPQPHLGKARAYAAQQDGWRHPGLGVCYWDDGIAAENMARDIPARKMFDNFYFVGNGAYDVFAIDTPEGIVLIDAMSNADEVDRFIIPGLKAMGLDPTRLQLLIVSHGHADHFGGAQHLKDLFGLRIAMTAEDWLIAPLQKLRPNQEAAPKRDLTIADGEVIRFGGLELRTFVSPGHTPGSLSMLIPVRENGESRTLLYVSGVSNRSLTPSMHTAFDKSYERLIQIASEAKVDGYLSSHPSFDDAVFKLEWQRANPGFPNPFLIGTRNTLLFLKQVKECNLNAADLHRLMPGRKASPRVGQ